MKIGMIGGIGPESTVDYYQRMVRRYQRDFSGGDYPEIVIDSLNMTAMLKLTAAGDYNGLASMLGRAVENLYRAGAELAFIASNTPHVVFERVRRIAPVPMVSIVEAARLEAYRLGIKKAGLLGTLFTMQNSYYQNEFEKSGIAVAVPNGQEQRYIEEKLFSEIERGTFLENTRRGLLDIIKRLTEKEGIEAVILGCTELPLILTQAEFGIPFLNTTQLHVDRIFETCRKLSEI